MYIIKDILSVDRNIYSELSLPHYYLIFGFIIQNEYTHKIFYVKMKLKNPLYLYCHAKIVFENVIIQFI